MWVLRTLMPGGFTKAPREEHHHSQHGMRIQVVTNAGDGKKLNEGHARGTDK